MAAELRERNKNTNIMNLNMNDKLKSKHTISSHSQVLRGGCESRRSSQITPKAQTAPSDGALADWETILKEAESTSTGARLKMEAEQREKGEGKPHTDATLRLFGHKEEQVRVTLFRDRAAWCPYCQKVWIMLEEKKIPYRVKHINMRSYGPKPDWFLNMVPGGLLPAIELDGKVYTDSVAIMQLLDQTYSDYGTRMIPPGKEARIERLYKLERKLFGAWCEFLFAPSSMYPIGMWLPDGRKKALEELFAKVDEELGRMWKKNKSPWFQGGDGPSLIDLQFISHIERMEASLIYWKGMRIRDREWENLERWLCAFDERESYQATKSDFYTHVMNIPPQYGEAFPDTENDNVRDAVAFIGGGSWNLPKSYASGLRSAPRSRKHMEGTSWSIPTPNTDLNSWEPIRPPFAVTDEEARHEAAYEMASNHDNIVQFACRAMGAKGSKQYSAILTDPHASSNLAYKDDVDMLLRMTTQGLLRGMLPQFDAGSISDERRYGLSKCLRYVRDRVGVPRDMGFPAAQRLRAHLDHLVTLLCPAELREQVEEELKAGR
eukprot:CAMPEP_0197516624 /NCGR_PEP_ID=MMETSP1318-20131121/1501_1 /TAXON_ID=552666 /ORGANISM="Partenskyella glossopodia, Strain RCC365" /LENGTH=548 /DNA_ID=CAMNT_0043065497 /DNA_START=281 /DNA_END=1927 /DNA_ORIENTATION=+